MGAQKEGAQFIDIYEYGHGAPKEVVFLARHFRHNVVHRQESKGTFEFSDLDGKKCVGLFKYVSSDGKKSYQDRIIRRPDGVEELVTGAECWRMGLSDDEVQLHPDLVATIVV